MSKYFIGVSLALSVALCLTACGGGGSSSAPATPSSTGAADPAAAASAPGGIYVGYYAEDPTTNTEDPTVGAVSVNLPDGNAGFDGAMYFTYVGCQTQNVGNITGTKADAGLSGTWAGTVDGTHQSGGLMATYQSATQSFQGTYTVDGGKQHITIPDCGGEPFEYYIAPNGTFELFPEGASLPADFTVTESSGIIHWGSMPSAQYALVYVADPARLMAGASPVVWQQVVPDPTLGQLLIPDGAHLEKGKSYIAVVVLGDASGQRIGFSSHRFTP